MKNFILCAIGAASFAMAEQLHAPARMRISTDLIQTIFHTGDQRMLTMFQEMQMSEPVEKTSEDSGEVWGLKQMSASVAPKSTTLDQYDFALSMRDPIYDGYFGILGHDLIVRGDAVTLAGNEFSFEADLTYFKQEILEVPETDPRILVMKESAVKFDRGDFIIDFGEIKKAGTDEPVCEGMQAILKEQIDAMIREEYAKVWVGDKESLVHLPVESLLPLLVLKNFSSLSTTFTLDPEQLEYGFDPDVAFKKTPPKKKLAMLKEIDSKFIEVGDGQDQQAIQIVIDENLINKYLYEFVLIDNSISLTQFLLQDPRIAPMVKSFNVKTVFEQFLPDLAEKYGYKQFDVMLSLSHNLLKQKLEGTRVTGFNQDKNGNFRLTFNVFAQILVDMTGNQDMVNAREIYLGLTYKGKFVVKEKRPGEKHLVIVSKSAEVSNVKILDEQNEESVVEQMMVTSFMNVQFEQLISTLPPKEFPLKNPHNPKEMECLGFELSDITMDFKKGYMQVGCGYKKVPTPRDPATCENFLDVLRNGPNEAMKMAQKMMENPDEAQAFAKSLVDGEKEEQVDLDSHESSGDKKVTHDEL